MVRKVIMLVAVVLVMGLSLLAIQCDSDSNKLLKEQQFGKTEQGKLPAKGLQDTTEKQSKMPIKGFY